MWRNRRSPIGRRAVASRSSLFWPFVCLFVCLFVVVRLPSRRPPGRRSQHFARTSPRPIADRFQVEARWPSRLTDCAALLVWHERVRWSVAKEMMTGKRKGPHSLPGRHATGHRRVGCKTSHARAGEVAFIFVRARYIPLRYVASCCTG